MNRFQTEVIGDATLILGDCREVLPTLPKVDAVVTDPPYGIGWQPRVNHQDQTWVDVIDFDIRSFLVGRFNIVWGGQYFADKLPVSEGWLTWCKRPAGAGLDFSDDARSYATTELAWRDFGKAKFIQHVWDGGMRAGCADNRTFCHPSQKPLEVMEWCIRGLPSDAHTILDPFMGSGTTGVACIKLGRRFIGIELEPKYFDIACRRIEEAWKQPRLFEEPKPKPVQPSLLDQEPQP
jgi:site-specific DNA-methyltransferase (adenine-specific)